MTCKWGRAGPSGRAVYGVGLRSLACWGCEFESLQVSASGRSLVQVSPTDCGVPECDREASIMAQWGLLWHRTNKKLSEGKCKWEGMTRTHPLALPSWSFILNPWPNKRNGYKCEQSIMPFSFVWSQCSSIDTSRGVFRPRQTRQLPRAVDLKGRLLSCQSY